jgi:hypothetical protein
MEMGIVLFLAVVIVYFLLILLFWFLLIFGTTVGMLKLWQSTLIFQMLHCITSTKSWWITDILTVIPNTYTHELHETIKGSCSTPTKSFFLLSELFTPNSDLVIQNHVRKIIFFGCGTISFDATTCLSNSIV